MAIKKSAGTLLYRLGSEEWEVLLVHASGAYNRRAPWNLPKGEPIAEENDLEVTARRETEEETGVVAERLFPLGVAEYRKSRKRIHCYAGPCPESANPRVASWEVDQVCFLPLKEARERIHPDLCVFLDRLAQGLADGTLPAS